jgi:hypothetical protein
MANSYYSERSISPLAFPPADESSNFMFDGLRSCQAVDT